MNDAADSDRRSMWAPLSEPVFRAVWIAAAASNIGTFMQDVGCAWLMTSLTPSAFMVALMQTATYLPFFMLSIPSGALADLVERRKLLAFAQAIMLFAALALGILTIFHITGPWTLLFLTFALGIGAAIGSPAWNALMPELVPRSKLEQAIALNSVGYNAARGIGAALGGIIVAAAGAGAVFILNAISFLGVIIVLLNAKHTSDIAKVRRERMSGAMRAGMRYVRHSPIMLAVFVKCCFFAGTAAALWALLPLIGRVQLQLDSIGYGLLLSVFGIGTLLGAFLMPILRRKMNLDHVCSLGNIIFASGMIIIALSRHFLVAAPGMILCGVAWVIVNASYNVGAQMAVPSWVRARAMAVYILVYQGSVAIGSAIWGAYAQHSGLVLPMIVAAGVMCLGLLTNLRYKLGAAENLDTTISLHWRSPSLVHEPHPDHGPVLVTVEYTIDPARTKEFTEAMNDLRRQRMRDGAFSWHLFCDLAQPSKYVETFMVESWGEHIRQHERVIVADRLAEERCDSFHIGDKPKIVRHMISAYSMVPPPPVTQELSADKS